MAIKNNSEGKPYGKFLQCDKYYQCPVSCRMAGFGDGTGGGAAGRCFDAFYHDGCRL